jgi:hypothetical protein
MARILLADSQPLFNEALKALSSAMPSTRWSGWRPWRRRHS